MKKLILVNFQTALIIGLCLSINHKESRANENKSINEDSFSNPQNLSQYRSQLISSEGRESYKWILKKEIKRKLKLNYFLSSLPSKIDFSSEISYIHTQGFLGSCATQSLTLSLEYYLKKFNMEMKLSSLYLYYNERKLNNRIEEDLGASLSDSIQALYKYGCCKEVTWPYVDNELKFKEKPSGEAYQEARTIFKNLDLGYLHLPNKLKILKQILARKMPIICGINIFPSFESDKSEKKDIISMPGFFEQPIGAHALTLVGYNDETQLFKFVNSWGSEWGNKGFGYLPYNYIINNNKKNPLIHTYPNEIWSIRLYEKN